MREIELPLPAKWSAQRIERAIDAAASECGLTITLRDSLAKFPGCVHWHLKNAGERGTLEVTYWPKEGRAWFSIQSGRRAEWTGPMVKRVSARVGLLRRKR